MAKLNLDAKQVLAEIARLIAELNAVKQASQGMAATTAANFQAMEASIGSIKNKVQQLAQQMNYAKAIITQQNAAIKSNEAQIKKLTTKLNQNTQAQKQNASATKENSKAWAGFNLNISSLLKGAGLLKIGQMLLQLSKNIYSTIKTFDSLSFTLQKITKDTFDYENTQRFLLRITKAYGVELITTTTRWSRFLAAAKESGLSLRETEGIFESMTKASAVLGLKTDELTSVYLALEQMLSKGKVTTEELRRQLGERLPGAMGIMAASMGKTIPELDKMLKRGEVLSAEVLPGFARAVERAYGIEQANRIETLIAKQNRLTAAWQTFIKNISEGDSVIKKVFGWFLDTLREAVEFYDYLFASDEQKLRLDISVNEEAFKKSLQASSDNFINLTSVVTEQSQYLKAQETKLLEQMKTAVGKERDIIQSQLDEISRIRSKKDAESLARQKEIAKERIDASYEEYQKTRDAYYQLATAKRQYEEELQKDTSGPFAQKPGPGFTDEQIQEARDKYILAVSEYNTYRKLVEESNVQVLPDNSVDKTKRNLRVIKDYWLETMNEILKGVKEAQDQIADDDTINLSQRLEALKKAAEAETAIRKNEYEIQIRDAEAKLAHEIDSVNDSVKNERLTREEATKHIKELEQEKVDFILLKNTELSNDLISINNEYADKIENLTKDVTSDSKIAATQDIYNKRIIAAKKNYEESKKLVADEAALEKELEDAARDAANGIIDVKIQMLRDEIAILEASGEANSEYITKLKQQINELEAARVTNEPIDLEKWQDVWDEAIDMAKEFVSTIGDLVGSIYDRRIENINAEIRAEEEKYDRLIALAEDNEEQQKTLERNKEDRIKKLERDRLKEEQKQAKARKKFAIADIAISTAKAIMSIWADFPKFDFGATAAIMSGVVAALGAAQIAAVLATPIPQYKEGVSNLSKDQVAMINDGSYQEFVERNNRILATGKKNAIVKLKRGDTVYKNYEDMASKSPLFKIKNINPRTEFDRTRMMEDVTDSVLKGIQKAKINNNLRIQNTIKDDRYRDSLSRWN